MLADYFLATLPQLIERAKMLKGKIPRGLPRDYDALISVCHAGLDDIIRRLRELQRVPAAAPPAVHQARLRQFKRAAAYLDNLETRAIAALNRAQDDDHQANRLLFKICQEIRYPGVTPAVTTLSSGYFYIDPSLNLMFIPPAEGNFLLHLPDLYHELAHPLLTHEDHPVLDKMRACFLEATAHIHDHFAGERERLSSQRGPQAFKAELDTWEYLWTQYWLPEFFCDLFAIFTLGPAFGWAHLHLFMKMGADPFELPSAARSTTHPADDARMQALLGALRKSGFDAEANDIANRWRDAAALADGSPAPNYRYCYTDSLIALVIDKAHQACADLQCRLATPCTTDPIHSLLNEAWRKFWTDPNGYLAWEVDAVRELHRLCR